MKLQLDTAEKRIAFRYIPQDSTITINDGNCIVYEWTDSKGRLCAIGYKGSSSKAVFHYNFHSEERRREYVAGWHKNILAYVEYKNEQKQKRNSFEHTLKVGDILYSSWGWEQTNIDFYQVTEVRGKFVTIQEISKNREETGWLQGTCTPVKDSFKEEPLSRKVLEGNNVKLNSYAYAWVWDGKPKHWTAYA